MIMGVSAGGVITKYMLAKTNSVPFDHQCEKFFSYDSPLRGANIPVSIQCLLHHINRIASENGQNLLGSNPLLAAAFNALNGPFAQQSLLARFSYNGPGENDWVVNSQTHDDFLAELDGLGAVPIRHIALSNGSPDNTTHANISPGSHMFNVNTSGSQWSIPYWGIIPTLIEVRLNADGYALSDVANQPIYDGYFTVKVDGIALKHFSLIVYTDENTEAYDTAPGGTSNLGLPQIAGMDGNPVPDVNIPIPLLDHSVSMSDLSVTVDATHFCFIPTRSSISAGEGISINGAFSCGQGTSDRCTMNTDPTPLPGQYGVSTPEVNQDHVYLDARIGDVLVDELDAANLLPGGLFPSSLSTYYNAGLPVQSGIPTITISTGLGELHINNAGKVGYANTGDPDSPMDHLNAYTKCDAVITVEERAKLVIGAEPDNKDATLHVTKGSIVHIKANGTLRINTSSALIIEKDGELILEAGAIVELYDQPGGALIAYGRPRIHVKSGGKLTFRGNIVFRGDGFFEFDKGNVVSMPSSFTFTGSGKTYRHFKINDQAQLLKTGGILDLVNCKVQVGCASSLRIVDFTQLVLVKTAFEDIGNGDCYPTFLSTQKGV